MKSIQLPALEEMYKLQELLNLRIDGDWYKNRTKNDLARAIWAECAELMGSLPWKWWATPNFKNVHIEVVDIWHFAMSYVLAETKDLNKSIDSDFNNILIAGLDWKKTTNHKYITKAQITYLLKEKDSDLRLIFIVEQLAKCFLELNAEVGFFYLGILIKETITFKKLYLLYVAKNILNRVRQEKGYKSGTYKKMINGVEDNLYVYELVQDIDNKADLEFRIREVVEDLQGSSN